MGFISRNLYEFSDPYLKELSRRAGACWDHEPWMLGYTHSGTYGRIPLAHAIVGTVIVLPFNCDRDPLYRLTLYNRTGGSIEDPCAEDQWCVSRALRPITPKVSLEHACAQMLALYQLFKTSAWLPDVDQPIPSPYPRTLLCDDFSFVIRERHVAPFHRRWAVEVRRAGALIYLRHMHRWRRAVRQQWVFLRRLQLHRYVDLYADIEVEGALLEDEDDEVERFDDVGKPRLADDWFRQLNKDGSPYMPNHLPERTRFVERCFRILN
ncbi:hypothetical protein [Salisaeta longa]|uniref:hypothetical protein n=1 Tax=Salisaeta longa TaxID=503170 RepID=UPI0012FA6B46|nr:hypothetical protein [Salisaeta longa]